MLSDRHVSQLIASIASHPTLLARFTCAVDPLALPEEFVICGEGDHGRHGRRLGAGEPGEVTTAAFSVLPGLWLTSDYEGASRVHAGASVCVSGLDGRAL